MNKKADAEHSYSVEAMQHEARLFRAGNSLAVRIPAAVARYLELSDGAALELSVERGSICLRKKQSTNIEDLIAQITPENSHEPMFEELIGNERW